MNKRIINKILTENKNTWEYTQYIQELKDGRKYITNGEIAIIFNQEEPLIEEYKLKPELTLDELITTQNKYQTITEEDKKIIERIKEIQEHLNIIYEQQVGYIPINIVLIKDIGISIDNIKRLIEIIGKREMKNIKYTRDKNTLYIKTKKYDIAIKGKELEEKDKRRIIEEQSI